MCSSKTPLHCRCSTGREGVLVEQPHRHVSAPLQPFRRLWGRDPLLAGSNTCKSKLWWPSGQGGSSHNAGLPARFQVLFVLLALPRPIQHCWLASSVRAVVRQFHSHHLSLPCFPSNRGDIIAEPLSRPLRSRIDTGSSFEVGGGSLRSGSTLFTRSRLPCADSLASSRFPCALC